MNTNEAIAQAIALIGATPGFESVHADLRRRRIRYDSLLADRGQAALGGTIIIGPEALAGEPDAMLVSLAGTLVHELFHTRQNPLLKTASFWLGIATKRHPMRRYERPAYARQMAFLKAIAAARPPLAIIADREKEAVAAAFQAVYGPL